MLENKLRRRERVLCCRRSLCCRWLLLSGKWFEGGSPLLWKLVPGSKRCVCMVEKRYFHNTDMFPLRWRRRTWAAHCHLWRVATIRGWSWRCLSTTRWPLWIRPTLYGIYSAHVLEYCQWCCPLQFKHKSIQQNCIVK